MNGIAMALIQRPREMAGTARREAVWSAAGEALPFAETLSRAQSRPRSAEPAASDVPAAATTRRASATPKTADTPNTPDTSDTPDTAGKPGAQDAATTPETPARDDTATAPATTQQGQSSDTKPVASDASTTPADRERATQAVTAAKGEAVAGPSLGAAVAAGATAKGVSASDSAATIVAADGPAPDAPTSSGSTFQPSGEAGSTAGAGTVASAEAQPLTPSASTMATAPPSPTTTSQAASFIGAATVATAAKTNSGGTSSAHGAVATVEQVEAPAPIAPAGDATASHDTGEQSSMTQQNQNAPAGVIRPGNPAAPSSASPATEPAGQAASPVHAAIAPASPAPAPAAAAAPEAAAPTADPQVDADTARMNGARVARGLQNAVQQGGGSMTLRLTPADLGTVRIQMQMEGGVVSAQFHTESEGARSILNQQLTQLRQALEGQGLSVERLAVQTSPSTHGSSFQQQSQQQADQAPHDGRSRGFAGHDQQRGGRDDRRHPGGQETFQQFFNQVA